MVELWLDAREEECGSEAVSAAFFTEIILIKLEPRKFLGLIESTAIIIIANFAL